MASIQINIDLDGKAYQLTEGNVEWLSPVNNGDLIVFNNPNGGTLQGIVRSKIYINSPVDNMFVMVIKCSSFQQDRTNF
ncbi:MAG: hypothetical protein JWP80_4175 [Pseudomonas sp.]|nr:hypothetical protein [Pseudomonas sp.]